MIDLKNALDIVNIVGATSTNFKKELATLAGRSASVALDVDGYIYLGYHKPLRKFYIDVKTATEDTAFLQLEYHKEGSWFQADLLDETDNLTQSGFLTIVEPESGNLVDTDHIKDTVYSLDGSSKYWYRLSASDELTCELNMISILFADDYALKLKYDNITDPQFLQGRVSHNQMHEDIRNAIVEHFKSADYLNNKDTLSPWDFIDLHEVREAAVYGALSRIFFNFSDTGEDIWMIKSKKYEDLYKSYLANALLSLDLTNSGNNKTPEKILPKATFISR